MRHNDLKSMSMDDLWKLHEKVIFELAQKMETEKAKLEQRLSLLQGADNVSDLHRSRRPYPPVFPKYQNPMNPTETWSGRGRQPRWLGPQIQAGRRLDDFLIDRPAGANGVSISPPIADRLTREGVQAWVVELDRLGMSPEPNRQALTREPT